MNESGQFDKGLTRAMDSNLASYINVRNGEMFVFSNDLIYLTEQIMIC